jgi:hypothetical protein
MHTVWKFPFDIATHVELQIPQGAQILHVAAQDDKPERLGQPCLWALVDPAEPVESRHLRVAGTGHQISDDLATFIGSFFMRAGQLVFHVWELRADAANGAST